MKPDLCKCNPLSNTDRLRINCIAGTRRLQRMKAVVFASGYATHLWWFAYSVQTCAVSSEH